MLAVKDLLSSSYSMIFINYLAISSLRKKYAALKGSPSDHSLVSDFEKYLNLS